MSFVDSCVADGFVSVFDECERHLVWLSDSRYGPGGQRVPGFHRGKLRVSVPPIFHVLSSLKIISWFT